ncbi:hypothetical protein G210_5104 [Candida maltosa Xu316]|uniref:Uncharacterized protein n=1 Tax=Candida maltosa (strain Xu316) TaxID=1245528 RepID=M3K586_CANMX|nr:hypothetical protein G210_5104 [Candida maltosa Xu316]
MPIIDIHTRATTTTKSSSKWSPGGIAAFVLIMFPFSAFFIYCTVKKVWRTFFVGIYNKISSIFKRRVPPPIQIQNPAIPVVVIEIPQPVYVNKPSSISYEEVPPYSSVVNANDLGNYDNRGNFHPVR